MVVQSTIPAYFEQRQHDGDDSQPLTVLRKVLSPANLETVDLAGFRSAVRALGAYFAQVFPRDRFGLSEEMLVGVLEQGSSSDDTVLELLVGPKAKRSFWLLLGTFRDINNAQKGPACRLIRQFSASRWCIVNVLLLAPRTVTSEVDPKVIRQHVQGCAGMRSYVDFLRRFLAAVLLHRQRKGLQTGVFAISKLAADWISVTSSPVGQLVQPLSLFLQDPSLARSPYYCSPWHLCALERQGDAKTAQVALRMAFFAAYAKYGFGSPRRVARCFFRRVRTFCENRISLKEQNAKRAHASGDLEAKRKALVYFMSRRCPRAAGGLDGSASRSFRRPWRWIPSAWPCSLRASKQRCRSPSRRCPSPGGLGGEARAQAAWEVPVGDRRSAARANRQPARSAKGLP